MEKPLCPGSLFLAWADVLKELNGDSVFNEFITWLNPNRLSDLLFWEFLNDERYPFENLIIIIARTDEFGMMTDYSLLGRYTGRRMKLRVASQRYECPVVLLNLEANLKRIFETSNYLVAHEEPGSVVITQYKLPSVSKDNYFYHACGVIEGLIHHVLGAFEHEVDIYKERCLLEGGRDCRWVITV